MPAQNPSIKQIINCAAYCGGRRVADVELDEVHEVLKEPKYEREKLLYPHKLFIPNKPITNTRFRK